MGRLCYFNKKEKRVGVTRPDPYLTGQQESGGLDRAGTGGVQNLTGQVGSGQEVFKSHGAGRVGSGRIRRFSNLRGRVGWGQEVSKISRSESCQVKTS